MAQNGRIPGTDRGIISCVGPRMAYDALLARVGGQRFRYLGGELPQTGPVLLLDTDLERIAACVKNRALRVGFFFGGQLLFQDSGPVMNRLAAEYFAKGQYAGLKQLNLIRMVLAIQREETCLDALPLHIQLEHTTFCNARCIMCDHFIAHNRGAQHIRPSALAAIEPLLPTATMVIMHGNGEPLLHPDILSFFDLYRRYQVRVSLNTNLSQINGGILDALQDNCASIHISCDGCTKEQYEGIRQGLRFDRFLENLGRLCQSAPDVEKVLEVVLMRQNITSAPDFVELAAEYGIKKVILNALGANDLIGNQGDSLDRLGALAELCCQVAAERGVQLGVEVRTPFAPAVAPCVHMPAQEAEDWPTLADSLRLHRRYPWYTNTIAFSGLESSALCPSSWTCAGVCEYPFAKTYIDLHGNVSYCCPASRNIVGTLTQDCGFVSIWNGPLYQRMRRRFYQGLLPALCAECYFIKNGTLRFLDVR